MHGIELSIIIINYNTFQLTRNCIESIYQHVKDVKFEILLIDNGSTEKDPNEFLRLFPEIKLIKVSENQGFGRANNLGMEQASGNYFLLLNSDTILIDDAFSKSLKVLKSLKQSDIRVLGCQLLYEDLTPQPSYYTEDSDSLRSMLKGVFAQNTLVKLLLKSKQRHLKEDHATEDVSNTRIVKGIYGAFMLMDKEIYFATKGFDPDFFMYAEEVELIRRINKRYKIIFDPSIKVIHLVSKSFKSIGGFRVLQRTLSAFLLSYKSGYLYYLIYVVAHYFNVLTYWIIFSFLKGKTPQPVYHDLKFHILKYCLWEIPKYKNIWGARKNALKLKMKEF